MLSALKIKYKYKTSHDTLYTEKQGRFYYAIKNSDNNIRSGTRGSLREPHAHSIPGDSLRCPDNRSIEICTADAAKALGGGTGLRHIFTDMYADTTSKGNALR